MLDTTVEVVGVPAAAMATALVLIPPSLTLETDGEDEVVWLLGVRSTSCVLAEGFVIIPTVGFGTSLLCDR